MGNAQSVKFIKDRYDVLVKLERAEQEVANITVLVSDSVSSNAPKLEASLLVDGDEIASSSLNKRAEYKDFIGAVFVRIEKGTYTMKVTDYENNEKLSFKITIG